MSGKPRVCDLNVWGNGKGHGNVEDVRDVRDVWCVGENVCGSRAVLPSQIQVSMFSIIVNSFAIWKDPSPSLNHHFIIQPTT